MKQTPLDTARKFWGAPLPDWVETLALACGKTSQSKVASLLGYSGAAISNVLNKAYLAETDRIEERVRGVYMDGRVACPGLGEIAVHHCQDWRGKAGQTVIGSPLRQRMYRACNACPRHLTEAPQ